MTIEKNGIKVTDTKDRLLETSEGIICGCSNSDLRMNMHVDGVDYCSSIYCCRNCGNNIEVIIYRKWKG